MGGLNCGYGRALIDNNIWSVNLYFVDVNADDDDDDDINRLYYLMGLLHCPTPQPLSHTHPIHPIQTCTVYPLAMSGGGGISGLNDPMMKGSHLTGAVPPHHLQHIHDVSALNPHPKH